MSTAKRKPGETTAKPSAESGSVTAPSGDTATRPPSPAQPATSERHEPVAPAYESHRRRAAGIIFVVVLLALAGACAYAWHHLQVERQDERQLVLQGNIDV